MKTAYLFPGQGSQFTGMGSELFESQPDIADRMTAADKHLGYSLTEIMFNGPEEKLIQTNFTQPAIFLHSVSLFYSLKQVPDMAAGHSLGEFSALTAAGCVSFEDGLDLVSLRGNLMQQASDNHPGSMAAIIGLDDDTVEKITREAESETGRPVVAANYNSPGQVVISGDNVAVDRAVELAKNSGSRLAKKLPVSAAFHSPLMQEAYGGLKEKLMTIEIRKPLFPIYSNVTATASVDPEEIRDNLLQQLISPVRWTQTLINMQADGAGRFIETGPGKVLQNLVKRTLKDVEIDGYQ